ncbi:MAG: acyltransferase family protein [Syntrophomonas sp.]
MPAQRESWLDITKSIFIVLIVVFHSGETVLHDYIYWFLGPAFFVLSGYVFKPVKDWSEFNSWLKSRVVRLLIPYTTFLVLTTLAKYALKYCTHNLTASWVKADLINVLVGGRFLPGVFWFVTCLFITELLFMVFHLSIKNHKIIIFLIGILYILAHVETNFIDPMAVMIPWNADVALITLSYYAFGYFGKNFLKTITPGQCVGISLLPLLLIILHLNGCYSYKLDLKYLNYTHIIQDLVVPITMTTVLCGISSAISKISSKYSTTIGNRTMPIMYMHIPLNEALYKFIMQGSLTYTIIGVLIPVLISKFIFERFALTRLLFLGIKPSARTTLPKREVLES